MTRSNQKALGMILEKLRKKDTYGVLAEPVDPEELPDYHDVIEHPMDHGSVRKKLAGMHVAHPSNLRYYLLAGRTLKMALQLSPRPIQFSPKTQRQNWAMTGKCSRRPVNDSTKNLNVRCTLSASRRARLAAEVHVDLKQAGASMLDGFSTMSAFVTCCMLRPD